MPTTRPRLDFYELTYFPMFVFSGLLVPSQQLLCADGTMPSEYAPILAPIRIRNPKFRALLVLTAWYLTSSIAVILTKALFSGSDRRLKPFPFGLTVTATNNVIASAATTVLLGHLPDASRDQGVSRLALTIGATTAAEIGLSNVALNLLSVSYATVLKGMAPFFVMAWGVFLGLQRMAFGLVTTMLAITIGLALAVAGQTDSNSFVSHIVQAGFLAQLSSALLSGFRWVLTQVFVKGETISNRRIISLFQFRPLDGGLSAGETIRRTAPYTLLWVLPFAIVFEGPGLLKWILDAKVMDVINLLTVLMLIGGCVSALLWAEYELVKVTSSLTVSIGFVLKEILVLFASGMVFNDKMSKLSCVGFIIVQCGIVGYAFLRQTAVTRSNVTAGNIRP